MWCAKRVGGGVGGGGIPKRPKSSKHAQTVLSTSVPLCPSKLPDGSKINSVP